MGRKGSDYRYLKSGEEWGHGYTYLSEKEALEFLDTVEISADWVMTLPGGKKLRACRADLAGEVESTFVSDSARQARRHIRSSVSFGAVMNDCEFVAFDAHTDG